MANHIRGPLYYERMGRQGPVMLFIHPNPLDQTAWLYQMGHFSTWYRCIAVDIPGYGRSPTAARGLTLSDLAQACWETLDDVFPGDAAILVGCSAGSAIAPQMYHLRPAQTSALILSGTGYSPPGGDEEWAQRRAEYVSGYRQQGVAFRREFGLNVLGAEFRRTLLAEYFLSVFTERDGRADVDSIVLQLNALEQPRRRDFYSGIRCPTLVLTGSEDMAHPRAARLREEISDCEVRVLPGAGHACQLEQPWTFDQHMIAFLSYRGLFPSSPQV